MATGAVAVGAISRPVVFFGMAAGDSGGVRPNSRGRLRVGEAMLAMVGCWLLVLL